MVGTVPPDVLIAADDGAARAALAEVWRRRVLELRIVAVAAAQAVAAARIAPGPLAAVAVEVDGADPVRLVAELRALPAAREAVLVALTSGASPDTLMEAETAGFSAFVFTPVDRTGLDHVLAALLGAGPRPESSREA